jgi:predicted nucleic acid-binding protein
MPAKAFFDTNVLIYAVAQDDRRSARAEELLASGGVLSVSDSERICVCRSAENFDVLE